MDMKNLLQSLDNVSTKPVEGTDGMAKFLRIVREADLNKSISETVEYLPPDPEISAQLRAQSDASMEADRPKHQANAFIRYSSGLYKIELPRTINIKPGVTLPVRFNPIKNMDGDVLANATAANKLLPPELQYSSDELLQVVGQKSMQETTLSKQVYLGGHTTLYLQQIVVSNQVKNGITPQQALAELKSRIGNLDPHSGEPPSPDFVKKYLTKKLEEGANPHKVALPVQMAMQHYQQPSATSKPRTRLIDKYFTEAEATILQKKQEEKLLLKQYAQVIAERVLMKENYNPNASPNPGFKPGAGPGIMSSVAEDNAPDAITVDVPLMIRLMEYAREDANTDMDLHNIAEKLTALSTDGKTLTMDDYESIVGNQENE